MTGSSLACLTVLTGSALATLVFTGLLNVESPVRLLESLALPLKSPTGLLESLTEHLESLALPLKSPTVLLASLAVSLESLALSLKSPTGLLGSLAVSLEIPAVSPKSPAVSLMSPGVLLGSPVEHLKSPAEHLKSPAEHLKSLAEHLESLALPLKSPAVSLEIPAVSLKSPTGLLASLAVSLESLALSLKSPTGLLGSLAVSLEIPAVSLKSPAVSLEIPAVSLKSPAVSLMSPAGLLGSPAEHLKSPAEHLKSLAEHLKSLAEHLEIPALSLKSPAVSLEIPALSLKSPAVSLEIPALSLKSPAQHLESLAVSLESPAELVKNPAKAAVSLCENCPFSPYYPISKPVTASSNSTNWPSSGSWSKSYRFLRTARYPHHIFSPHSPDYNNPLCYWIQIHARFDKKVYGWLEACDIILLYAFFIYCCARERILRQNNSCSSTSGIFSALTSVFTTKENKEKSVGDKANDPLKGYGWIFKFPSILWQKAVLVYPVFQPDNLQRIASYSKLAFRQVSETVSFIQLSNAGFKYTGHDLQVTCDECHKSLNIRDFASSPSEARYHELGCSFVQTAASDAINVFDPKQWSPASDTPSTPLSETRFPKEGYGAAEAQATNEVQTSGQSQWSVTGSPPTPPCIHDSGFNEEVRANNIPTMAGLTSRSGDGTHASHDIEEDGASNFIEPIPKHVGGHDQAKLPGISSFGHPETRANLQQGMTQRTTRSSPNEASTTPDTGSGETQNQNSTAHQQPASQLPTANISGQLTTTNISGQLPTTNISGQLPTTNISGQLPTTNISRQLPTTNISGQLTAPAGDQATSQPGASGLSCPLNTQHELDETTDFQPEIYYSDKDVQPSGDNCFKNPGHYSYFPIGNFRLEYIPTNVRTPEVLSFFSLVAKLTVRVVVLTTSRKRPRFFATNEGPKFQFGTGFAVSEPGENYDIQSHTEQSGKLSTVRKYLHYGKKNGHVYIETNRRLVKDNAEAENATVEFFYDQPNRRGVVVAKGVAVHHSCVPGDLKSILVCRTSDVTLVHMVQESTQEMENMANNFPQNIKEAMMRRVFLFSHPHGAEKVFSFGEYVMVKYQLETTTASDGREVTQLVKISNHTHISQNPAEVRKLMLYTAETCPGSTGAVVVSFKQTGPPEAGGIVLDLWMHNGVDGKHSLNASVFRSVTTDDIANHGHQIVFRPTVQEDMMVEAERAANQVVNSPVFTVSRPPCHPAYVTYKKRLESYPHTFIHVHTREDLADAGFFCAQYADCVRCFQCGLGLKSWRGGDVINMEHFRNRPDCQFLLLKLRESGIDVSTLAARLRQSRSTEQPQTTANTELELELQINQHVPRQRDEGNPTLSTLTQEHKTDSQVKTYVSQLASDTSFIQLPLQEVIVNCVQTSPPETRAPADTRRSAVAILEREQYYLKQIFMCKVCCKNQVKDLFLPCGELVACVDCSKLLTHCPSCNRKILATVTTYFS